MGAPSILVADDDPHIRDVIDFALRRADMVPTMARDGGEALALFRRGRFDLAVLDVGMPEMDGLALCGEIRKRSQLPILFLSARDEEVDRVLGLEIGGDDYLTKPFSPRELVARIKAILKRSRPAPEPDRSHRHGRLVLDAEARLVAYGGAPVALTALEFAILAALTVRPRTVFTRDHILDAAYGVGAAVSDRTVDSHVRNIRAKLAAVGCRDAVETVHGVGFRLGACGGDT
ncbi:response regulator transcription factor [Lichenibacterium minor]|uniref:Response regulator transcription factor n=1 Tax=Lichenibacterium minor TaxID=2316528 RepID=A0A4Q2U3V5_9HYPH|nr:response regulator transcription factor [Lichenibacterium minor]RYC30890.1 response regulator transcription factor [Lichenibacterium minor]